MHTRRKFLTQSSLTIGAFTFLKPLQTLAGTSSTGTQLSLLFTNGLSGGWHAANEGGTLPAVKEAVTNIRREQQHVLLVDTGNVLSAGSERTVEHLHQYHALKETGYDAVVPGTTDLQHGTDYYQKLVERSGVTAVATNYCSQEAVVSYRIARKGSIKIGILGIGCADAAVIKNTEALVAAINEKATWLKEKHRCGLVVCLSHLPLKSEAERLDNFRLAAQTTAVDVMVSANDDRYTHNTHVVKNKDGYDVLISHAGKEGSMLGRLDITLTDKGETIAISSRQVYTGASRQDTGMAYRQRVGKDFA